MQAKKLLSLALGVLMLVGVIAAVFWSSGKKTANDAQASHIVVKVLTGSEKMPLLTDPRFEAAMARQGLIIEARKAGSREIAVRSDLASFDVAFPAGQPAAAKIRQAVTSKAAESVLVTPMVIASWKPVAELLKANGIVREADGALWVIDMEKLLALMTKGERWRDLPGNKSYAVGKSILISTTDVRTSNSAAQFLALASYLFNGRDVVADSATASKIADQVVPFFAKQGFQESSSAGPFEDYMTIGLGKVPLVWVYESQYIEQALKGALKSDMVLLYPQPTVFSKHTAVALSDPGMRFLAALKDPEVQAISADYGYRVEGSGDTLKQKLQTQGMALPDIIDVADAPAHDFLEQMISEIETRLSR
ncbi:substrate-binding domain-containing protein [Thauera sinica]|uniref:Substrate-binding domain-containing protein n=1 Tax=Thauera sinica TaxID=2665146 RepID=A0ABW1AMN7_9RHOO|nr:substrate-binding domain-containing protein [Thauera sp. K11]ATE60670.1 hypothetical protein CCZ27_12600 [Thauera sp. K11]